IYVSAGAFSKDNNDTDGDSNKQVNLRGVFAPLHDAGNVLHFGFSAARRDVSDSIVDTRFRSRLGMRGVETTGGNDAGTVNGNRVVFAGANNTAAGNFDDDTALGLEAAWATGPFSLQGEYMTRKLKADASTVEDIKAKGYYVQAAYTLTGEARGYKLGKFDAIKPANNQIGAWELFYRYDSIKVEDDNTLTTAQRATLDEGDRKANVHNLGVNWYANEAVKISATYVKASVDNVTNNPGTTVASRTGDDDGDGFIVRAQYAF
ncbi:MAG: porin, partial [Pseudomonas sp.]|uniref:OprO/OprP family phosphate-selective porin n=1 Tax=Pseudomonas sp. TaxID=306 RepID=UPI0030F19B19